VPLITGDKKRLTQLFLNLLHNAIKFSYEAGRVRIKADHGRTEKGLLGISVLDEGVGISSDIIEKIFDRFYQADSKRHASGLGLGLAIVKRIVEAHEGELEVESQESKGSTFTVYLPLHRDG
jgi:signal transduction histidine kinase